MRIALLTILCSLLSLPASAQQARWLPILTNDSNLIVYFDTAFLSNQAGLTTVQTYHQLNKKDEYGATKKIVRYRFNCDRRLWTIESLARLDDNNIIISFVRNEELNKLTPVTQKSIVGVVYKYACIPSR